MALQKIVNPSIATITGTSEQVLVSNSGRENSDVVLSLPQNIDTISSPQFYSITIQSSANVSNVNANNSITLTSGSSFVNSYSNGFVTIGDTMNYNNVNISSNGSINLTYGMTPNTNVKISSNSMGASLIVENYNMMSGSNSNVGLYSNGYLIVANGNSFSNTKVELFANGQANVGSLYINNIQINPNSAVSNNVLLYNGISFVASNIPDATTSSKGIASFNSNNFSVSSGNVSLSSNMYSVAQTVQSNTSSILLTAADAGKLILMNTASNAYVNVASNTNFTTGQSVDILVISNTMITFANNSSAGTTINGTPGVNTRAQYSSATILCIGTNSYVVVGDLKV